MDIGTYPRPADNPPLSISNYESYCAVENGAFSAWGELIYTKPLTAKEQLDYELRPARRNPDVQKKMDAQAQVVGKWEDARNVPEPKRLLSVNALHGKPPNDMFCLNGFHYSRQLQIGKQQPGETFFWRRRLWT